MASPSDLIEHYSSRAFLTRIAALTSVGAVVGAVINRLDETSTSALVGVALMSVVISLGELNRRYTNSYKSACRAAAKTLEAEFKEGESGVTTAKRWKYFRGWNEEPYKTTESRFFLNWLTYFPGLILGEFLILKSCWRWEGKTCYRIMIALLILVIGLLVVRWWWRSSAAASDTQEKRSP